MLSLYDYSKKNGRGGLIKSRIVDPGKMQKFIISTSDCDKRKHKVFTIKRADSDGNAGQQIASSIIMMRTGSCRRANKTYEEFTDVQNDAFGLRKENLSGGQYRVNVRCLTAGSCEQQ